MAYLRSFMNKSQTNDSSFPYKDDDIYPVHILDDNKTFRNILITWTLCFNDALDAERLRLSLSRLLDIGDWRKIGGRLRLKANGALEIHVPRQFTVERPAFSYSHNNAGTNVESHAVAKSLPQTNGTASIWPGPQDFDDLAARGDAPKTLADLLVADTPQISVHVTSFTNASIVALSWPHTLMDVMGQRAFLHAWSLVLAGRDSEVPHVLGAREDVLCSIIDDPARKAEEFLPKSRQLQGFSMFKFGTRFVWDMLTGPTPETHTICLSEKVMTSLRAHAQADLAESSGGGGNPFVSDGDVLVGWTMRAVAQSLQSPRPMTALHAINARFRLPLLKNAKGVYLQNMLIPGFTFVSPTVAAGPIGPIALSNRQHLLEQTTEGQVVASLQELRAIGDSSGLICSDADAVLMPFTDWTKAKFFETADFSPAIVRTGDTSQTRHNPPGTLMFHHASSRRPNPTARLMVVILGNDHGGNYWLTLTMSPRAWANIKTSLTELGQ